MNHENCVCPICKAKTVKYRHSLQVLVPALIKFYNATKTTLYTGNPGKIGLTINQHANWQKIRYWGLAERTKDHGQWYLTIKGLQFLRGEVSVPIHAITYRGHVEGFEGPDVFIKDFPDSYVYLQRKDYAMVAEPEVKVNQLSLIA